MQSLRDRTVTAARISQLHSRFDSNRPSRPLGGAAIIRRFDNRFGWSALHERFGAERVATDRITVLHDPWFYLTAVIAVMIVGIAKGGLGSGIGIVGVPLMSLTITPVRAAAIMLPILLTMDLFAMRVWWRRWDRDVLETMLLGGVLGTLLGFATFRMLSANSMRLLVGAIALAMSLEWFLRRAPRTQKAPSLPRGTFWGTLAGFTSFGIHAGGPPTQAYLLSLQLDKGRFQGVTVAFFFMLNWLKTPMFAWLGQLDFANVATSLVLLPLAPLGIWIGRRLHDRIDERLFYRVIYASLLIIGTKLIYDATA
jgi:uncharacterized membrane protein YfcA